MQENKVNPWTWIITVIIIIVLIILGFYFFAGNSSAPAPVTSTATTSTNPAQTGEANRISVTDQFPGNIVYVSSVQLAAPGYVVIKTNNNGTPGSIIGTQAVAAGINPAQVNLTQSMVDGSTYYAALYSDAAGTQPIVDSSGNPVMAIFHASANANANIKG
jgi:hypothetical protein